MASFMSAVFRLTSRSKPQESHMRPDEESGQGNPNFRPRHGSTVVSSTSMIGGLNQTSSLPNEHNLNQFRLMLGITNSSDHGFGESSTMGSRPAPNIGIYARVIYAEQNAKDSFKVFNVVINACYFLQIVVAAALTALGAAGVSNGAVTAFGAINTVIAGFLTFLKGSGLPNRLQYYGNEWQKIREFIEQRERDFAREPCSLDIYKVVATIDQMYTSAKEDIQMNTPDSYTSVSNSRHLRDGKIGGIDISKLEGLASKIPGREGMVHSVMSGVEKKAHGVLSSVHDHEKQMEQGVGGFVKSVLRDVEDHKTRLEHEAREREGQLNRTAAEESDTITGLGRHNKRDLTEAYNRVHSDIQESHDGNH
jgi:hypothetical protein